VRDRKDRILISSEIAKLALEENLVDVAFESAALSVAGGDWDIQKNLDLVIA
jgi:hypothetical protein